MRTGPIEITTPHGRIVRTYHRRVKIFRAHKGLESQINDWIERNEGPMFTIDKTSLSANDDDGLAVLIQYTETRETLLPAIEI